MASEAETVRRWISACNARHAEHCLPTPISERPSSGIPRWVIDCREGHIVPGSLCPRYIALSYRWGAPGGFFLTSDNVDEMQKDGFLDRLPERSLPVVLLEAMDLVESLGERYLWVDRLCIIQNHTHHADSDVHTMGEIYAGAYLTIIAAGDDRLCGCAFYPGAQLNRLNEQQKRDGAGANGCRLRPRVLHGHSEGNRWLTDRKWSTKEESSGKLKQGQKDIIDAHYMKLLASDWARRGWTFQEQILSRRCVIFLDDRVFWDCQCSVWDESYLTPESDECVEGDFAKVAKQISCGLIPDFPLYLELVCLYNNRDLTYSGDGLRAMTDILQHFGRSYPGGLVSGLPRLFLDAALLWQPVTKAKRRGLPDDPGLLSDELPPSLPSWSWCGWQCTVDPKSLIPGLENYNTSYGEGWTMRNLVQWSVTSADISEEEPIQEPQMLNRYKTICIDTDPGIDFNGWIRSDSIDQVKAPFRHPLDPCKQQYKIPVPTLTELPGKAIHNLWPYLSCETTSATFAINAEYIPSWRDGLLVACAVVKTSVFNLPNMLPGVPYDDICHVISLVTPEGEYAGVIRLMDGPEVHFGQKIELIAISTGSAEAQHIGKQCEESLLWLGRFDYKKGANRGSRVSFVRRTAEGTLESRLDRRKFSVGLKGSIDDFRDTTKARRALQDLANQTWAQAPESAFYRDLRKRSATYQFYNVLWVERKSGIAYRRGAGRVVKSVWEKSCGEPLRILLG